MKTSKAQYGQMVSETSIKSPIVKDCMMAFLFGGGLCTIAELFRQWILYLNIDTPTAGTLTSVLMVFIGVFLTGIGVYDSLAKIGGAGTLIPITGFANSVAAPIMEFKTEGYILGIGVKFFAIAGPVISWGTIGSVIYGILYFIYKAVF